MRNEPLISVIIYVKDSAERLKKCLETLSLQIYKNIEIICIDSGLNRQNIGILDTYKIKFNQFEVLYKTGLSAGQAWNEGLKTAKGNYIQFVNSDCWFLLDLYKVFADTAVNKAPDISIINSSLYKEDMIDIPYYELFDDEDLNKFSFNMIYSFNDIRHILTKNQRILNKIYKIDFLRNNNLSFAENNIYCEYLFNLQTLLKSSSVYINPETYMRHTEQIISDGAYTEKVFNIFDMITKMQEYLIAEKLLGKYVFDFFNFICNSLDKYYEYCPDDLKQEYFMTLKQFILSRFSSMPPEIQDNYRKIDEVNCLITSDFEEYNSHHIIYQ